MRGEGELRAWTRQTYDANDPDRLDFTSPEAMEEVIRESLRVVTRYLGSAWLERELHDRARFRGASLGFDDDPDWVGPIPLMRLWSLAYELHEVRSIPGFAAFAKGLRSRSLTDATAEMWAVRHCMDAGQGVRFVDPHGHTGRSPDAITILSGMDVAVEVKARAELPIEEYHRKKVLSTLGSARRQLPATGPSLVYLRVSPPWSEDEETLLSINDACMNFLRNTRRVNAVVLMVERRLRNPGGAVWPSRRRPSRSRTKAPLSGSRTSRTGSTTSPEGRPRVELGRCAECAGAQTIAHSFR